MKRLLLSILLLFTACSPLRTFETLVPKDVGVRAVGRNQAFAPGPRGMLDLYAPVSAAVRSTPLPVIVFFYGGSWNSGSKDEYGFAGRALAARGFIVAVPDYRLVPAVHYPDFLRDNAAAVRWVRANAARFGGDPDRIVLAGHSAGGYAAAMLSLDPEWLGKDREAIRGFAALAGPYRFLPLAMKITRDAFGGAPDLEATQPINYPSADDPPALLLAGAEDDLVAPAQSVDLAAAMTRAGAEARAIVYPGIGHAGILTALATIARGRAPVLKDVADFAHRVTAGPRQ